VHADLILCYKILHDTVDIDKSNIVTFDAATRCTRGHGLKLRALKPNNSIGLAVIGVTVFFDPPCIILAVHNIGRA